ncbi:hypothetical protein ACYX34_03985 [Nitrospira sp. CMX1]|nr:hypothetical protein [Nitrospira sp.]MBS0165741.1 hypothetical protein [Nitrospira sp.]MBX3326410.1 hypothetical protein [Nitrospira sp.]
MRIVRSIQALLVVSLLLHGCAFSRGTLGDDVKTEVLTAIQKGITTKIEVVNLLGAPDRLVQLNGRDVFHYYRYDAKAGSLLLIILNFTRLSIKSDDVFIIVNREGIVEDVLASKRTESLGFRFWPFGE